VLIAPAFPAAGRRTEGGIHLVDGVPLAETGFARDPFWPARESRLEAIVSRQTRRSVTHLPLSVALRGPKAVAEALDACPSDWITADATEPYHLDALAAGAALAAQRWLLCGSAGLAQAWGQSLGLNRGAGAPPLPSRTAPTLVIAGTRHPLTGRQLRLAESKGALGLVALESDTMEWDRIVEDQALPELLAGQNTAVSTTFSSLVEGLAPSLDAKLAQITRRILRTLPVSGMVITGGDTLLAVCAELGALAVEIDREVQPGVAAGALVGGSCDGLRIVAKGGGMGDEHTIVRCIEHVQGGRQDDHG
jgi:uncharacterized protein YgbK (DUF1537 family)